MSTLEEATEFFLARTTTIKDAGDPAIEILLILHQAIVKSHELLGTDVPRSIAGLNNADAIVAAAKKRSISDKEEETDDDDLSMEELAERAERNRNRRAHIITLPRLIRLPEYGSKPKKVSVARDYDGKDKHLYALVLVNDKYIEASSIASTGNVAKRLELGEGLSFNKHVYLSFKAATQSNFVITVDEMYQLAEARTAADIARANSSRPVAPLDKSEEPEKPLEECFFTRDDEEVPVKPDRLIHNRALKAIREGKGRVCTNQEPHSATGCWNVHTVGASNSYYVISERLYRVKDCIKNVASEALRTGKYSAGKQCCLPRRHDEDACNYMHLQADAKAAAQSEEPTGMTYADFVTDRSKRKEK
jgi:hypothetical protein